MIPVPTRIVLVARTTAVIVTYTSRVAKPSSYTQHRQQPRFSANWASSTRSATGPCGMRLMPRGIVTKHPRASVEGQTAPLSLRYVPPPR